MKPRMLMAMGAVGASLAFTPNAALAWQERASHETQNDRLYISAYAGATFGANVSAEVDFGRVTRDVDFSVHSNLNWGLAAGYQRSHFRVEAEFQQVYVGASGGSVGAAAAPLTGSFVYNVGFVNAYGLAWLSDTMKLFAGGGLGYAQGSAPKMTFARGCRCERDGSDSGFAWQLRAGLEYDITNDDRLFVQYTYMSLPELNSGSDLPQVRYSGLTTSTITVGYRRAF